ncbi:carbonic anhydrase family protein [Croceivirga thetidis]|uniref:Carbonic anhydrase n=1 Tax=Croceivirga thetidis TaxID=2721623 RepID=A0ABX1GQQ1_9FLAO|nr:carbonic anhydrase family protein [Croceivirga thetidis]NKI31390.1 carbonic anhydrase [Croceivirga thetidis]
MMTQTKESQAALGPDGAIALLKDGNVRFVSKKMENRDLIKQVEQTATGQYPFATVLSCIDSRVSAELVFDQGVGDIFSARVAGNIVNADLLGSMEFACKLAGTKVIVVLGHTACGAVKGACDDARLGNLTLLLSRIRGAVDAVQEPTDPAERTSKNATFVNAVAEKNVLMTIENIRNQSPVLKDMEDAREIKIVGAMYDIADGKVHWM